MGISHNGLQDFWDSNQIQYKNFIPGAPQHVLRDGDGHGAHVTTTLLSIAQSAVVQVGRITLDGKKWNASYVKEVS